MATVTLTLDPSEVISQLREVSEHVVLLDQFLQLIRDKLLRLSTDQSFVGVRKPTFRAGQGIVVLEIQSADFEFIRSALRALNLNVAHTILSQHASEAPQTGRSLS